MSANAVATTAPVIRAANERRKHRTRLFVGYLLFLASIAGLAIYGLDYYLLDWSERPFSQKHVLLRPSGIIGLKLGFVGLGMFLIIFLYPLRKRWPWLSRLGNSRHWLDFHVLLGIAAPFVIAFHASFKFRGFAGIAFWIMLAVSLSGLIGRYVYAQIPRSLNTAELSLRELQDLQAQLARQLAPRQQLTEADLRRFFRLPSPQQVANMSMFAAVPYMITLDMVRPLRIARLRRRAIPFGERIWSVGGLLRTRHAALERSIQAAREEASLAKRILFLSRSQQVFHLWHVIHKPFSYSFALLAIIHIVVVMMMGYH